MKKIVLAYSGGLDTSIILRWLQENYNSEVIAYTADIGQVIDRKKIIKNAKRLGVKKIIIENLKKTFVQEYVFPMIRAHALYEGMYYLGTSIARPLIGKRQIFIAKKMKAFAVLNSTSDSNCNSCMSFGSCSGSTVTTSCGTYTCCDDGQTMCLPGKCP